jgi:hypothetical protein
MWGIWFIVLVGVTVGVAVLIGLAVGASPIFALLLFIVVGGALAAIAAFRRSAEYVEGREGGTSSPPVSGSGAPVSGEGDRPS